MNLDKAIVRACQEASLEKALTWICVWECERAVRQAQRNATNHDLDGRQWETMFQLAISGVTKLWNKGWMPGMVPMESFPAGESPFNHDLFHMGTRIGQDLIIMHKNHTDAPCKYLIFCNVKTGERFRMEFEECTNELAIGQLVHNEIKKGESHAP